MKQTNIFRLSGDINKMHEASQSCLWVGNVLRIVSLRTTDVGDGGQGGHVTPKIREKYFSGNYYVKFEHFVNFSFIFFGQKFFAPLKLTELLRVCCVQNAFQLLVSHFQWCMQYTSVAKCRPTSYRSVDSINPLDPLGGM